MSKKIIITGATGQDGSYMAEYLSKTENTLVLAARRTSQSILSNLEKVINNPRVKIVTLDLMDGSAIRNIIREEKPDYFINLGAQTFVADSWQHPEQHMQVNAISLIHILEAVREYVPHCRVYSSGSSEQFGDVDYSPQNMAHPLKPRSIYGVSKCSAALICKVYRESYGLYVVHGVLFNHESPRRQEYFVTRKITKGVARIKAAIKAGKQFEPIELGNLDAKRDWSDARDFVDGIWKMLNQPILIKTDGVDHPYGTMCGAMINWQPKEYVLASGETHSIREFIATAFEAANFWEGTLVSGNDNFFWVGEGLNESFGFYLDGYSPETNGYPTFVPLVKINPEFYRPAEVNVLCGDSTPARVELGWEPKIPFKQMVKEMVEHDEQRT